MKYSFLLLLVAVGLGACQRRSPPPPAPPSAPFHEPSKAPAKLDELAKEGLVPFIPLAPPGGRYELDAARGAVRLAGPTAK